MLSPELALASTEEEAEEEDEKEGRSPAGDRRRIATLDTADQEWALKRFFG